MRVKSNTASILTGLDTYHLPEREDGICLYCGEYNSELGLDGCCVEDKHSVGLTCKKARRLRALSNGSALDRGEIKEKDVDPLEGFAWEIENQIIWHY